MIYTIETDEYGKIEIDTEKMIAYHYKEDMEYVIGNLGRYQDFNGRVFEVIWPVHPGDTKSQLILRTTVFKEIGRSSPR